MFTNAERHKIKMGIAVVLCAAVCGVSPTMNKIAVFENAVAPYFTGYVDEIKGTITAQNVVYDISNYSHTGKISVTSTYAIENVQTGTEFCYPVIVNPLEIGEIEITVNGKAVQSTVYYGDMPQYYGEQAVGTVTVEKALETVCSTEILDGIGFLYKFECSQAPLEISFRKNAEQSIFHGGLSGDAESADKYYMRWDKNTETHYQVFVTDGELFDLSSNVAYTRVEMSYKTYVDFYVDGLVSYFGEAVRRICYSRFNRNIKGKIVAAEDVFFDFSATVFALLKTALPTGNVQVTVHSFVEPFVNTLYTPCVYGVRTVTPYPKKYSYTAQVKLSENLPYITHTNLCFENGMHKAEYIRENSYFTVCSQKNPKIKTKNVVANATPFFMFEIPCLFRVIPLSLRFGVSQTKHFFLSYRPSEASGVYPTGNVHIT